MRAPGRVKYVFITPTSTPPFSDTRFLSLIGEHIDYALFGVFPAAIERDILLACAPSDSHGHQQGAVRAQNLEHRFPPQSFSPLSIPSVSSEVVGNEAGVRGAGEWHLDIDKKELRWESYVKAGYYVSTIIACPTISGLNEMPA